MVDYPEFSLVLGADFKAMSRGDAARFCEAFIAEVPQRLDNLVRAVGADASQPVHSGLLANIHDWCSKNMSARLRTTSEVERVRASLQPRWQFLEIDNLVPDAPTISAGVDAVIYLAECLRSQFTHLQWVTSPSGPRSADHNRPVLSGFVRRVTLDPIRVGIVYALKVVDKTAKDDELAALLRALIQTARS